MGTGTDVTPKSLTFGGHIIITCPAGSMHRMGVETSSLIPYSFYQRFLFKITALNAGKYNLQQTDQKNHNKNWYDWNMVDIHSKYSIMFCIDKERIAKWQTNDKCYTYGTNRKNQSLYLQA